MIEFLLFFALGFLTAAILGLIVAPFVYRRIVRFAENRLMETVPLSAREVRAQKDAARAGYAAENARTSQGLRRERDKATALMTTNEKITRDGQRLAGENTELRMQIADMSVEAADLRSSVRQLEQNIDRLKSTLETVETDNEAKSNEIRVLSRQLDRVSADVDSLRIDVVARTTESENLKSRIAGLRDERESIRDTLKAETARAREMEARLAREATRIRQLESRVTREVAAGADKDNVIERRAAEIERLRTRLKEPGSTAREPARSVRGIAAPASEKKERKPTASSLAKRDNARMPVDVAADPFPYLANNSPADESAPTADDVRNRAAALSERLILAHDDTNDEALREEIAEIAATLVAITAMNEGGLSPIHSLLAADDVQAVAGKKTLGDRARARLAPNV